MQIVRFSEQERVDLPDLTQVSFLVLGEFRRHVRGLLIGEGSGYQNLILEGFAVEAQAVPDATVRVRLQIGGMPLGFAIAAENVGARVDFGQLAGGDGMDGALEGNASTALDFTGQPNGTYRVQMRFVYSEGTSDNRAFWDDELDSEFIDTVDTRYKPAIELRFGGAPSDEWVDLADVAWNGATIQAADITDVRTFAFEGASPFQASTQADYASLADFNRSPTRNAGGVGLNAVYPVLRALGRQIADIKGQAEDGSFDWFSRVYGPLDPLDALADEQTRSLRTVDVVTFTVGDGTSAFGDFNGATGLESCLQHIEDMGASAPANIEVVLKSRNGAAFAFSVTTAHVMHTALKRLTIDCQGHRIVCSHPAASYAIEAVNTLAVRNLSAGTITTNAGFFKAGLLELRDVTLTGNATSTAAPAVIGGQGSVLERASITGVVQFVNPGLTASGTDNNALRTVHVADSVLNAVEVTDRTGVGDLPMPLHMRGCVVTQSTSHGYGKSAAIDFGNNSYSVVERTRVVFNSAGGDGVRAVDDSSIEPSDIVIRDCVIEHSAVASATAGNYAVRLTNADRSKVVATRISVGDVKAGGIALLGAPNDCLIEGCDILGLSLSGRPGIAQSAVYMLGGTRIRIAGCSITGWEPNVGVDGGGLGLGRGIMNGTSGTLDQLVIDGCAFTSCGGYAVDLARAAAASRCAISGNSVYVPEATGGGFNVGTWTNGACVGNAIVCASSATSLSAISAGASGDGIYSGNRCHNCQINTAGAVMYGKSGGGGPLNLNYET